VDPVDRVVVTQIGEKVTTETPQLLLQIMKAKEKEYAY
jgi:hypothetical protein